MMIKDFKEFSNLMLELWANEYINTYEELERILKYIKEKYEVDNG